METGLFSEAPGKRKYATGYKNLTDDRHLKNNFTVPYGVPGKKVPVYAVKTRRGTEVCLHSFLISLPLNINPLLLYLKEEPPYRLNRKLGGF
jgi:hypothetical protein